ncbi:MAG: hypothetical protein NTW87_15125 [Planctomycetota bacterium]|nr:hypothetical protein [Planctomycetota bacterium]
MAHGRRPCALRASLVLSAVFLPLTMARATAADGAGVVSHISVLSDKVEDVSSLNAWKKACLKDGMTDEQKAMAIWTTVVKFQHQDGPPFEFLHNENFVQDAIKIFNVYGYSFCGVATADVEALARHAGLKARGWTISRHVVSEVWWDDSWHLLDASLICYFPKADRKPASVEEIIAGVSDWLAKDPALKGNDAKLREFQFKGPGWRKGPEILALCPTYSGDGWLPAFTHGWYSQMQEYDGSTKFPYEPGYSVGYQVNTQLRKGERLTRNWSNKGLHVNMQGGEAPGCMSMKVGESSLRYTPKYGDLSNGRVGNGTLEYDVPLADGSCKAGALSFENLACKAEDKADPALHVKDGAAEGTLILRMPSSYVYLGGELSCKAAVGAGGEISAQFSDNNGLDWKEIAKVTASGEQKVDLKPHVFRRYDYRLKLVLKGKGTGLDALKLTHDIQHSQRPLPALGQGANTIAFSAGPQEGTITIEGSTIPATKGKQLTVEEFHPQANNMGGNELPIKGAQGDITFPIATPGDMTRLRLGAFYRARDPKEGWELQVSFDGGKTFKTMDRLPGNTGRGDVKFITFPEIPPGTRAALVRYTGVQRTACLLMNLRIDADYVEPHGGFRPVRIGYSWEENGQAKQDVHIAKQAEETYTINCASKPTMKSIVLELAE